MRVALKFAYLGGPFHGYARQPRLRTVEGDILEAMAHLGIADDARVYRFQSASRTDAGVSALGNVVAVDTDFRVKGICRALNTQLEDIWFWASAVVGDDFNPRHADERWYRYHLPSDLDCKKVRQAARLFEGRHDFRAYTPQRGPTVREIKSLEVSRHRTGPILDVRGPSFLWNMVRRIVAALDVYARGSITFEEIRESLARGTIGTDLAPAAPLVLMDVLYSRGFEVRPSGPAVQELARRLGDARARVDLFDNLLLRMIADGLV